VPRFEKMIKPPRVRVVEVSEWRYDVDKRGKYE
jgi:hypothetical protein